MKDLVFKSAFVASLPFIMVSEAIAEGAPEFFDKVIIEHDGAHVAAEGVHHGGEHAASPGLPQMDPTWFPSQIFWLAITFFCLYVIFAKKILPALSNTIDSRHEHIQNDLDMAEQLKEEAEGVQAAYDKIMDKARQKSSALFVKTDLKIKENTQKSLDDFRDKSAQKMEKTEAKINKTVAQAKEDMHDTAAEIASIAAEKIVGVSTDAKQVQDVIQSISRKAA